MSASGVGSSPVGCGDGLSTSASSTLSSNRGKVGVVDIASAGAEVLEEADVEELASVAGVLLASGDSFAVSGSSSRKRTFLRTGRGESTTTVGGEP